MNMKIGFDFKNNNIIKNENKEKNITEENLLLQIVKELNIKDYDIVKNSDDYTTLTYKEYDIVRIKYTDSAKWISICLCKNDKKNNIDNILFKTQKNKNQLFWKSYINNDINVYYEFIKNRCNEIDTY